MQPSPTVRRLMRTSFNNVKAKNVVDKLIESVASSAEGNIVDEIEGTEGDDLENFGRVLTDALTAHDVKADIKLTGKANINIIDVVVHVTAGSNRFRVTYTTNYDKNAGGGHNTPGSEDWVSVSSPNVNFLRRDANAGALAKHSPQDYIAKLVQAELLLLSLVD